SPGRGGGLNQVTGGLRIEEAEAGDLAGRGRPAEQRPDGDQEVDHRLHGGRAGAGHWGRAGAGHAVRAAVLLLPLLLVPVPVPVLVPVVILVLVPVLVPV